ncbi:MAG: sigma factor, partial [Bacteroidota bacterium]
MSSNPHDYSNQQLLDLLQQDSRKAIDLLFQRDYEYLCRIAYRVLKDTNRSEDIVQDVFFELWKKRETIQIKSSIKAYLRRAVINKTLNFIRDQKIRMDDDSSLQYLDNKENIQHDLEASEMQ